MIGKKVATNATTQSKRRAIKMASLKEKKEQLKEHWESCFEMKMEDVFKPHAIKRYWDDETDFEEAGAMFDKAALHLAISALDGDVIGGIIMMVNACEEAKQEMKAEACDAKNGTPYEVERVADHYFYSEKFSTEEEAKEFIKEKAMTTEYTLKDFRVVKVIA